VWLEGLDKLNQFNNLIETRTRDLSASTIFATACCLLLQLQTQSKDRFQRSKCGVFPFCGSLCCPPPPSVPSQSVPSAIFTAQTEHYRAGRLEAGPVTNQASPYEHVWRNGGKAPLIPNMDGGEWSASRSGRFTLTAVLEVVK
jgi:hypothetical protein